MCLQIMHQSERVTSTSGGLEEGEESDSESWPGDSTSPTDNFYSDSDFDDTEGAEVLTSPRERTQNSGGLPQHNGSNRSLGEPRVAFHPHHLYPYLGASGRHSFPMARKVFTNHRERYRQQNVSGAFMELRKPLPSPPIDKKISKSEILKLSIRYIRLLEGVLKWQDEQAKLEKT